MLVKSIKVKGKTIPVKLPDSFAARMDLLTVWQEADSDRRRLLWAILGMCWGGAQALPQYRPERGDRDVHAYAASICNVVLGKWGLAPGTPVEVTDEQGEPVEVYNADRKQIPVTLWTCGLILHRMIEESIPRPEAIEDAANFTRPSEVA